MSLLISTIGFIMLFTIKIRFAFCESDLNEIDNLEPIDISYAGNRIYGRPDEEVGKRLKSENLTQSNPEELGTYFEGDILIPRVNSIGRNGMLDEFFRWPKAVVPIVIGGSFTKGDLSLINGAIDEYHKKTCIRFKKRENEKDYIIIKNDQTGCWSNVGRSGGAQTVNLQNPGCTTKIGTILHEFLHALGFLHEQNREDRDGFVEIKWSNVQTHAKNNFEKATKGTTTAFGVSYDFESVMHYTPKAFAVNKNDYTITTKNANDMKKMGQREGFSALDVKKIWKMYKCKSSTSSGSKGKDHKFMLESITDLILNNKVVKIGDEEEMTS